MRNVWDQQGAGIRAKMLRALGWFMESHPAALVCPRVRGVEGNTAQKSVTGKKCNCENLNGSEADEARRSHALWLIYHGMSVPRRKFF
jgi:hypothetical protein